uniref:Uncharacterized protein n=1 Tax=viral metagenome TaxID=1070528 RepID=A0A6C0AD39_9ZZZZ
MKEIKKSDLPDYAKNSKMYEDISDDEIVLVPLKFLIYDETINNFKDYKRLIKSYRYFLSELSKEIIEFQENPENRYNILHFFIKHKDDAFFQEQLDIFENIYMKISIRGTFMEYFFEENKETSIFSIFIFENESCKIIIEEGIITTNECYEYLENIKKSNNFEIGLEKLYVSFIFVGGVVFVKFYQNNKEYSSYKFKISIKNLTEVFSELLKNMKKSEKLIKSKEIFGISHIAETSKNMFDTFSVGILKKDDLIFGDIDHLFKHHKKIEKGITKNNIESFLKKNERIVYF